MAFVKHKDVKVNFGANSGLVDSTLSGETGAGGATADVAHDDVLAWELVGCSAHDLHSESYAAVSVAVDHSLDQIPDLVDDIDNNSVNTQGNLASGDF